MWPERSVVDLNVSVSLCQKEESIDKELVIFLNRLSDALFVFARWVAKQQGEPEFLWQRESAKPSEPHTLG